ncbi:MAG: protein-L-isoaspartate(D-aspartate) O-methyltransferase [Deltaproteobacteria bacterium]|nr:protein-L-isoaspartate(D-aspartate) O-methyltransferase [Deltaproteobacteria bacterium]
MATQDFEGERRNMVEEQLRRRGISDPRVLQAMEKVPRHLFVPPGYEAAAYEDHPLPIGGGQTISQPYIVAIMTQLLELKGSERVLEIGTGSGYQTAVLAELARSVFTIERLPELLHQSRTVLQRLGYTNIFFRSGDGSLGWPEVAPFDGIVVTAGAPEVPEVLKNQLGEGRRLVIPVGSRYSQTLFQVTRRGESFLEEEVTGCVFVPLVGEFGWQEE